MSCNCLLGAPSDADPPPSGTLASPLFLSHSASLVLASAPSDLRRPSNGRAVSMGMLRVVCAFVASQTLCRNRLDPARHQQRAHTSHSLSPNLAWYPGRRLPMTHQRLRCGVGSCTLSCVPDQARVLSALLCGWSAATEGCWNG